MDHHIPYFSSIDEAFQKNARIGAIKPHFELYMLNRYPTDEVPEIKPFRLNAYVIGFITSGSARLHINAHHHQLQRGSLYFSSPWDIRAYSQMKNWDGFLLFFTPDYLSQFQFTENRLSDMRFFQPDARIILSLGEEDTVDMEDRFRRIETELSSENPHRMKVLFHYIHILMYRCREMYERQGSPTESNGKTSVSGLFLEKLNNHFLEISTRKSEEQLTIQHIADELHLHPHYLSDLVKKQTGKTATQIIRERYVQEAKILLRNTQMSISEISYYLHFKDTSNFSKFFKNIAGITPREYKEQLLPGMR